MYVHVRKYTCSYSISQPLSSEKVWHISPQVSEHLLSIYLDEYEDTPWDALKYLVRHSTIECMHMYRVILRIVKAGWP